MPKPAYYYLAKVFVYKDGKFHFMVTYHNIDSRNAAGVGAFEKYLINKFRQALHHVNYYYEMNPDTFLYQKKFYNENSIG